MTGRLVVCTALMQGISYGQVPERDTLSLSQPEIEGIVEGATTEPDGSQVADILDDRTSKHHDRGGRASVRIRMRVQTERPFPAIRDPLGSPMKAYQRILFDVRENSHDGLGFKGGIVTEKDPGERFSDLFAAGYLQLNVRAMNGRITVGDFVVESGKGLIFWRSSGITKGGDLTGVVTLRETRIEPYHSTDENHFLRGVALEKDAKWLQMKVFFSDKRLNGSRNADGVVTSLDTDGLFRTESELRSRGAVREIILGGVISANLSDGFTATVKGASISLGAPLALSRYNAFFGTRADVVAADFKWKTGIVTFAGEVARDGSSSVAVNSGLLVEIPRTLSMAVDARIYPRSFNSLHGFALSEGGIVEGESGVYLGASIRLSRRFNASLFYDTFFYSHRFLFASQGNDFLFRGTVGLIDGWEVLLQYRRQGKPALLRTNDHGLENLRLGRTIQERYRLSILHSMSDLLKWQARIEITTRLSEHGMANQGYLVFQEMRWQIFPTVRISFRMGVFETDGFDTRMFAYEPDVPGGFSNIAVWNSGFRTFLLADWSLTRNLRVSAKYSFSHAEHPVGRVEARERERIAVQCDVTF